MSVLPSISYTLIHWFDQCAAGSGALRECTCFLLQAPVYDRATGVLCEQDRHLALLNTGLSGQLQLCAVLLQASKMLNGALVSGSVTARLAPRQGVISTYVVYKLGYTCFETARVGIEWIRGHATGQTRHDRTVSPDLVWETRQVPVPFKVSVND
jgi:hypothetical protein